MDYKQLPTVAERLTYAMSQRKMVQEALAERVGCSQTAIQKITSGKTQTSRMISRIARALAVDLDWLELGIIPSADKIALAEKHGAAGKYMPEDESLPVDLGELSTWDDATPLDEDEVLVPLFKEVELASGGGRSVVSESSTDRLRFSKRTLRKCGVDIHNAACATNTGNSNYPLILPNASLGIDKGMTRVHDGEIYAIDHSGLLRVKFLYRLPGGGLKLRSFNRDEYTDEEYSFDDIMEQRIQILGRVFWWSSIRPLGSPPLI